MTEALVRSTRVLCCALLLAAAALSGCQPVIDVTAEDGAGSLLSVRPTGVCGDHPFATTAQVVRVEGNTFFLNAALRNSGDRPVTLRYGAPFVVVHAFDGNRRVAPATVPRAEMSNRSVRLGPGGSFLGPRTQDVSRTELVHPVTVPGPGRYRLVANTYFNMRLDSGRTVSCAIPSEAIVVER